MMRFVLAALLMAAVLHLAATASAFRTATDLHEFEGTDRVRWSGTGVIFDVSGPLPAGMNPFDFSREAVRALGVWSRPECSGFSATFGELAAAPAKFGDGRNTIQMVSSGWKDLGYSPSAAGATDIRYEKKDGGDWSIAEADIYINGEFYKWTTEPLVVDGYRTIFSVLLHEGGHALGLLHPCEENGEDEAPKCAASGIHADDSVMFPVYDATQDALTADDQAGVCFLYRRCERTGCPVGFECGADECSLPCPSDARARCTVDEVCSPSEGCLAIEECAATNCLKKDLCAADADCDLGSYCDADGACKTGSLGLGDPCNSSHQCKDGVCVSAGYCAIACTEGGSCPVKTTCQGLNDDDAPSSAGSASSRGACVGSLKGMAEECHESNECFGGECLDGASVEPMCTRRCGEGEPKCPAQWTCELVKGRSVCAPIAPAGGCALVSHPAPTSRSDGGGLGCLGGALVAAFTLRAARRRTLVRNVAFKLHRSRSYRF
jgi:hypothetical protein